jgi:hypothetical protein
MPVPTADISMNDIQMELMYATGTPNESMVNVVYASSDLSYNTHAGSYHNLAMALPSMNAKFAAAIQTRFAAGTNMNLGNWAEYSHDANARINIIINNGSRDDVIIRMNINDNASYGGAAIFTGTVLANNAANVNLQDFDTGQAAYSSYSTTNGYWLTADLSVPAPTGVVNFAVSAVDVDNVGTGTVRTNYTTDGSPGGPWNLGAGGGPFADVLVAGANGSSYPFDGVSWNKRTAIIINIF